MKNKAALLALMLSISFLSYSGCKQKEPGRYYNKKHSFSIKFPQNWEINEGDKNTAVMALNTSTSPEDIFPENLNIVVTNLPEDMTLEKYLNEQIEGITRILTKITELDKGKTKINNVESAWVSYIYNIGEYKYYAKSYFILKGKKAYTITSVADKADSQKYAPITDESINSFRFE